MLEKLLQPNDEFERCGLVLKDGSTVEISNIAQNARTSYEMKTSEVLPHLEDVVGTWHTHPISDPTLSGEDHVGFLAWPNWKHWIIGIRDNKVAVECYEIVDGVLMPCA